MAGTRRRVGIHIGLHPDRPVRETVEIAVAAEALGYAGVWIADSQNLFRDAFCALSAIAPRTARITIGTGVTNPVTRHASVIAGAIGTIDELSNGRAALGIGTGETAVESLGLKRAKLAQMRECTRVVRELLAGSEVEHDGARISLAWPSRPVPIVIASTGPRSLQLAGSVADGVYLKLGANPDIVRYALRNLTTGAAAAGRDLTGFAVHTLMPLAVDPDGAAAREAVKGFAGAIARAAVLAIPREDVPERLWEQIEALNHASSAARARQSYVEWLESPAYRELITDEIVAAFAIAGTPAEVADQVEALAQLGVTGIVAPLVTGNPWPQLRAIGEHVVPAAPANA